MQEFGFREVPEGEPHTTAFAQQPAPQAGADQAPQEGAEGSIVARGASPQAASQGPSARASPGAPLTGLQLKPWPQPETRQRHAWGRVVPGMLSIAAACCQLPRQQQDSGWVEAGVQLTAASCTVDQQGCRLRSCCPCNAEHCLCGADSMAYLRHGASWSRCMWSILFSASLSAQETCQHPRSHITAQPEDGGVSKAA